MNVRSRLFASDSHSITSSCGRGYGSGPSNSALTMLNTAVQAPMPMASVRMTIDE